MAREFNMLTPENDMKHSRIHPGRDVYRFEPADSLVAFAEANGMQVRGHTLVWHQQLASWLTSGTWTADESRALLQDHITKVAGHYRGHVIAWDVVNEALADDGSLRSTFWLDHIGRDYIELAFRAAHDADPDALLFYNDYNIEGVNAKSDSAYELIRGFLARGVPIHGIGLQAHFQVGGVPATLGANIARFAALGLKVHITELDVRMQLPSTSEKLTAQANDYRQVLQACVQSPACGTVVMWGFTDKESWVPGTFTGWGDALIMDAGYQPKPAFRAIYDLLK
jgi:endo-1,4-beta-xylanase